MVNDENGYGNVFLTASLDAGGTFVPPQQADTDAAPGSDEFSGDYRPLLAVAPGGSAVGGELFMVWTRFTHTGTTHHVMSCDRKALRRFTTGAPLGCNAPIAVNPNSRVEAFGQAVMAVGGNGRIYVAWADMTANSSSGDGSGVVTVQEASSADGGRSFGGPHEIDRMTRLCPNSSCPPWAGPILSVVARPSPGEVVVAYSGLADGVSRVRVTASTNGGTSWEAQLLVPVSGAGGHGQHSPQLAVSPDGRIDLAFYDLGPDGRQDVYLTSSNAGRLSFGRPRRLTQVPSDDEILFPPFSDARMGLVAGREGAAVAWADSRRGSADSGKSDIFFATTATLSH